MSGPPAEMTHFFCIGSGGWEESWAELSFGDDERWVRRGKRRKKRKRWVIPLQLTETVTKNASVSAAIIALGFRLG